MRYAIAAAVLTALALPAHGADLGGNGMADLEERIAELEATTARKGNRKVSLVISGQISKAMLWHDIDTMGGDGKMRVIDNGSSPSVMRFAGDAKLNASFSAGFIYEFGVDSTRGKGLGQDMDDIYLRHAAVWLSTPVGKVTLGQTATATDGVAEITVANTAVASRMMSVDPMATYAGPEKDAAGRNLSPMALDGDRHELVRYDTPTLAGFMMSVAYAPGASLTGEDIWDVALRYSGEFSGFRMAAGAGYRHERNGEVWDMTTTANQWQITGWALGFIPIWSFVTIPSPTMVNGPTDTKTLTSSASVMHMGTGLFANLSAAKQDDNLVWGDMRVLHVQGGMERNFFGIGATTMFVGYGDHRVSGGEHSKVYEAGIVQAIDGLAADLFLTGRMYDTDGDENKVVIGGMRIKF